MSAENQLAVSICSMSLWNIKQQKDGKLGWSKANGWIIAQSAVRRNKGERSMDKNDLKQYPHICAELEQLENEIEKLRAAIESPPRPILDGMPKGKGKYFDRLAEKIAKLVDLRTIYERKWDRLINLRRDIEDAIEGLEPEERRIMRLIYIEGARFEKVAVELNYSYRHIQRIHQRIIKKMSCNVT